MAERLKSSKKSSSHWWPVSNSCAPKPGPKVGSSIESTLYTYIWLKDHVIPYIYIYTCSIDSPWFTMIHHRRDSEPRWSRLTSEIVAPDAPLGWSNGSDGGRAATWDDGMFHGIYRDIPWYTDTPYLHLLTNHGSWSNFIWIIPVNRNRHAPGPCRRAKGNTLLVFAHASGGCLLKSPTLPRLTCSKSQLLAELRTVTWGTLASWQSLSWNQWGSGDGDGWCGYGTKFTWKFSTRQIHVVPGSKCLIICQHWPQKSHHSIAVHGSHFLFIWPWVPKWCASGGTSPGTAKLGCGPPGSWAQNAKRLGLEATGHDWTMVVCCCVLSILLHQSPARQIRSSRKDPYLTMRTRVCFQFFHQKLTATKSTATKSMSHDWLSVWCWFSWTLQTLWTPHLEECEPCYNILSRPDCKHPSLNTCFQGETSGFCSLLARSAGWFIPETLWVSNKVHSTAVCQTLLTSYDSYDSYAYWLTRKCTRNSWISWENSGNMWFPLENF